MMKNKILVLSLVLILVFAFTACGNSIISSANGSGNTAAPPTTSADTAAQPTTSTDTAAPPTTPDNSATAETVDTTSPPPPPPPTTTQSKDKTFGDLIEFDDLQIVFGNEIIWTALDNQFSDKNGMEVFLVPIIIKNVSNETHGLNMFYYDQYGSKGTKLDGVGAYFDNDTGNAGDMRPGAKQESVMSFLYDGDGDYYVEFSTFFGDTIEVKLPIIWGDNAASPLTDTPASIEASLSTPSASAKTFGDLFEFDDLEMVFGENITWTVLSNQFSEKNGMDVFLVPLTIKNVKNETHSLNMFYYTQYGSHGTKLDSIGSYFDNEVGSAGSMRSGASQDVVMAFLYDGDGDYYVEFSQFSGDKIEVMIPINK